jgi:hypothetical protein
MTRWRAIAVAAWIVLGCRTAAAQTVPPATLGGYVVLARDDVSIGGGTHVTGSAVGTLGGTVRLGRATRVAGTAVAPVLLVGRSAHVDRAFCGLARGPTALPACRAFTSPAVDPALLTPVVAIPGTNDLTLRRHTVIPPVTPGTYGDIAVGAGALLQLAGGDYVARSIRIARAGGLTCVNGAVCRIAVAEDVVLRRHAAIGAASSGRAETVRIDVAGTPTGPAFLARPRAQVAATIYAPDGAIVLGTGGSYRGAWVGRSVTIGHDATVRADSAL